jgi:hypothetical protein
MQARTQAQPTLTHNTGLDLPQFGDIFVSLDDAGHWSTKLRFVCMTDAPGVADFARDDTGELFTCKLADVQRLGVAPEPPTPAEEAAEGAVLERHLHRTRSRTTAPQRARKGLTEKQRIYIFRLAADRGLDADELRALTPRGSVKDLTVWEASQLIDRLRGPNAERSRSVSAERSRSTANSYQKRRHR